MRIFVKLATTLVIPLEILTLSIDQSDRKKNIGNFSEVHFITSFTTSSARCSQFQAGKVVLFQIKVLGRNIKETKLEKYFINVTDHPSFT